MAQFKPIIVKNFTKELDRVNGVFTASIATESSAYPAHKQHPTIDSYRTSYESGRDQVAGTKSTIDGLQSSISGATMAVETEIKRLEIALKLSEAESVRVERLYDDLLNGDSAAFAQLEQQTDNNKITMYKSFGLVIGCGICIYGSMRK
jgi:hypothetical protein